MLANMLDKHVNFSFLLSHKIMSISSLFFFPKSLQFCLFSYIASPSIF